MTELDLLIAEQERDMRYGDRVFSIALTDSMAEVVIVQDSIFGEHDAMPYLPDRNQERSAGSERDALRRLSQRHHYLRKTLAHLGGRIVTCPGCGQQRRVVYLNRDYNRKCLPCMGLERRKAADRCDKGHVGEIYYGKPKPYRNGIRQRYCRACERERYLRLKASR